MRHLLIASLVWAFSFGLIKTQLSGVDPFLVAWLRLLLSLLVFVPWLRSRSVRPVTALQLMIIGAVQYGFMYMCYIHSYRYLAAHQVALFTIFTPIFVTGISGLFSRRLRGLFLISAALAVLGAGVVAYSGQELTGVFRGFGILQLANLCFAYGQVRYRMVMGGTRNAPACTPPQADRPAGRERGTRSEEIRDREVFALLYLGAVVVSSVPVCLRTDWAGLALSGSQWLVLVYLGVLPSGVCFFLWNKGARRTGTGTLAVFNNVKIPLAVLVSLVVFGEKARLLPLAIGGAIILGALALSRAAKKKPAG